MIRAGRPASPITLKVYFEGDENAQRRRRAGLSCASRRRRDDDHQRTGICSSDNRSGTQAAGYCRAQDAVIDLQTLPIDVTGEQYVAGFAHELALIADGGGGKGRTSFTARDVMTASNR